MTFHGRGRELGALRSAFDRREASVIRLTGLRGVGKSALVERATESLPRVCHTVPPLPGPDQVAAFAAALRQGGSASHERPDPPSDWAGLFDDVVSAAAPHEAPFVLVIDDAHRLTEARSRFMDPLVGAIHRARSEDRALHVVLVGLERGLPPMEELASAVSESLALGPLPFRAASGLLPGSTPRERLRAYGVLGGIPRVLSLVDPTATLATNIRRLLGEPGTPLLDAGERWLELDVQTPSRYNAVLTSMAHGALDWSRLHAGVADLTTSGQVAPYVRRLRELGLIDVLRSLDARPHSRARRYRIADPFLAFWFRFVFPRLGRGPASERHDALKELRTLNLDDHMTRSVFPEVCRQYMTYDVMESVGANARECGGLWGPDYDIPVAGILRSGAAFYGLPLWTATGVTRETLAALDIQIRETRYGFGRERRQRLLFAGGSLPGDLRREVARRQDAMIVDARALVGAA